MNRQEFLWQLRTCLSGRMPPAKIEDVVAYYEEYFLESGDEGEAAVMAELGDPREVAARILGAAPAWEPPPPAWEGAGFVSYNVRRHPYNRWRGVRTGLIAAVVAMVVVSGLLFNIVGSRSSYSSLSTIYDAATPEPTRVQSAAVSVGVTNILDHTILAPFSNLNLDLSMASVDIIAGDDYSIEFYGSSDQLQFASDADGLRVWEDNSVLPGSQASTERPAYNFQSEFDTPRVVITLPYGASLTDVTLRTGFGSISVDNVSCRSLVLEAGLGEISLSGVTADQMGLTLKGGTLTGGGIAAKEAKLNGSLGSVSLYNSSFDFLSVDWQGGQVSLGDCTIGDGELRSALGEIDAYGLTSYGLRVNGQNGMISLSGTLYGLTEVTQSLGAVEIWIDLARSDFSYDLQTALGSITLDGRGDRGHVVSSSDAPNSLTVQNKSGSINVNFAY